MRENDAHLPGRNPGLEGQPFADGTPVYDAAGAKIGSVSEHNLQVGYLVVHKSWPFPKVVYIPASAVGRGDAAGVYLNTYKDDLKKRNWESPPTQPEGVDASATREEGLSAPNPEHEASRAQIHQEVSDEPRGMEMPVTHEQISVERVSAPGVRHPPGPDAFQECDIEVPVMGEHVTTEKRTRVSEEIHLHKQEVTEQQLQDDTVC